MIHQTFNQKLQILMSIMVTLCKQKIAIRIASLTIAVLMMTKFQTLLHFSWKMRTWKSYMRLLTMKRVGQRMIK